MLNVVGPYRLYGEPVVRACAECGTDYLDVSGEPEFMERMEAKYHDVAAANGCRIASAAGYDSVPGDFGTVLCQQEVGWRRTVAAISLEVALHMSPYTCHDEPLSLSQNPVFAPTAVQASLSPIQC